MKRLLSVGDIHGEHEKLIEVLKKAEFDPQYDMIVFLGDYIDRGPDSKSVVDYLRSLQNNFPENVKMLRGNHEQMAYYAAMSMAGKTMDPASFSLYMYNGGKATVESYNNSTNDFIADAMWLGELPLFYETDKYYFCHAGIHPEKPLNKQDDDDLLWIREHFIKSKLTNYDKIIVHGHTPSKEIELLSHRINLDTGCGKGGKLSLYDLTNKKVYSA